MFNSLSTLVVFFFFLGLTAKIIDRTNTMSDVYGAFFDFSCILKSKVWYLLIYARCISQQGEENAFLQLNIVDINIPFCLVLPK